jgi:hypothetical protein
MKFEYILPVITLILGWFLKEIENYFLSKRQSKQAISRAIADLLDVHHELSAYKRTLDSVQRELKIPITELFPVRQTLVQNFLSRDIATRYEEAVTVISSNNPLLGFNLRSRASITRTLESLGSLLTPGGPIDEAFFQMEAKVIEAAIGSLREIIIDLSKKHSFLTWYRVKKYLAKPRNISSGSIEVLKMTQKAIEKISQPAKKETDSDGVSQH